MKFVFILSILVFQTFAAVYKGKPRNGKRKVYLGLKKLKEYPRKVVGFLALKGDEHPPTNPVLRLPLLTYFRNEWEIRNFGVVVMEPVDPTTNKNVKVEILSKVR